MTTTVHAAHDADARRWTTGWQRYVYPGVWLGYLAQTVAGVVQHSSGVGVVAGCAIVGVFAACYLAALPYGWTRRRGRFWQLYAACVVLSATECIFAQGDALVFLVYLGVLTVAAQVWWSFAGVGLIALAATFVPALVPSWHDGIEWSTGVSVALVALAMWGFFHLIANNRALASARAEIARLAAEGERSRIARDLHDLLGHSLTTITIKAGLARRLAERGEAARSLTEITEVEQLSRRTLGDVRAAVAGHREMTLAGELATAGEVLRAAGVEAELPASVDVVEPRLSEIFGWVLREGTTNLVRHAHARRCRVLLGPRWIEITDDGRGAPTGSAAGGHGLPGLRERLAAHGGELTASGGPDGFRLRAEITGGATGMTP